MEKRALFLGSNRALKRTLVGGIKKTRKTVVDCHRSSVIKCTGHVIKVDLHGLTHSSHADFNGKIPLHLGNLTSLISPDLSWMFFHAENLKWLSRLILLRCLDLSSAELSSASANWFHIINKLCFITELYMNWCHLSPLVPFSLTSILQEYSVSLNLKKKNHLSIRRTNGDNNLTEEFDSIVETLCGYAQMELQTLDLSCNALWGSSSGICLFSRFPLLGYLGPHSNIRLLSNLKFVDLSDNSLEGNICDKHFSGLLGYGACTSLLSGEIPNDYWKYMYHLEFLNMSNNKLSGTLPSFDELQQVRMLTPQHTWGILNSGKPLPQNCPGDQALVNSVTEESFGEKGEDDNSYAFCIHQHNSPVHYRVPGIQQRCLFSVTGRHKGQNLCGNFWKCLEGIQKLMVSTSQSTSSLSLYDYNTLYDNSLSVANFHLTLLICTVKRN
ncbi:hypothetical protein Cgig2_005092 [Carnegiea gigantea]|uniref:Uncharacterized protein n=1 Tax=Carnegiea gigantea TaxID=171969 RepID=A0A9Q1KXQ7_9CARY|nr:hypothetical protein Cgig2_005092 [Carnegiea gigantea]